MELVKSEINAINEVLRNAQDLAEVELLESQLLLIGGGIADPIFC